MCIGSAKYRDAKLETRGNQALDFFFFYLDPDVDVVHADLPPFFLPLSFRLPMLVLLRGCWR